MGNGETLSANAIIAQALENAGVPPRNIEIPPEPKPGEPVTGVGVPNLDGSPKGQVVGEELEPEEDETPEAKPSEPKPGEPTVPPLGKADIEAAITEASSKFQSIMDRKINNLQVQMQQTIGALNQFFQSQEDSGISGLPENEQVMKRLERLEKPAQPKIQIQPGQPIEQQSTQFYQQLANFVDTVGLKIDDKRIDWAPDVDDPKTGFNRFLASIKAALVADQTKAIQDLKNTGDKELQKIRKKTGVDKVSTSGPGGTGIPNIDKMTPMEKIEYGYKVQEELSQVAK